MGTELLYAILHSTEMLAITCSAMEHSSILDGNASDIQSNSLNSPKQGILHII
jgi:hypothetical protein